MPILSQMLQVKNGRQKPFTSENLMHDGVEKHVTGINLADELKRSPLQIHQQRQQHLSGLESNQLDVIHHRASLGQNCGQL